MLKLPATDKEVASLKQQKADIERETSLRTLLQSISESLTQNEARNTETFQKVLESVSASNQVSETTVAALKQSIDAITSSNTKILGEILKVFILIQSALEKSETDKNQESNLLNKTLVNIEKKMDEFSSRPVPKQLNLVRTEDEDKLIDKVILVYN